MSWRYVNRGFSIELPEGARDASLHAIELPGPDGSVLLRVIRLAPQTSLDEAIDTWLEQIGRSTLGYCLVRRAATRAAGLEGIDFAFDHRVNGDGYRSRGLGLGLDACVLLVLVSGLRRAEDETERLFERVRSSLTLGNEGGRS